MLRSRGEIIQKLRQLGKNNSTIIIHFNGNAILSSVVDVLTDKNLLVLDCGADEALNKKLTDNDHAIVKTDYQGITAQFSIHNIRKARLHGNPSFACDLPEQVLWVQRREFYRVKIPLSMKVTCELIHGDNHRNVYPVLDVSTGGLAIFDINNELELEPGNIFHSSKLVLNGEEDSYISLEVRNHIPLNASDLSAGTRCGCAFMNLTGDFASTLQRFINLVDIQQKRIEE